jgi:hypothetical protein
MDAVVSPEEPIARFLRNSNHMRTALSRPHFTAFLPKSENGEISVYRVAGLNSAEIKQIGVVYVQGASSALKGHAVLAAESFFARSLNIIPHPEPHPRHANAMGWETDAKNRVMAKELADAAVLLRY